VSGPTVDRATVLVVAKAPVPGRAKTRLATDIGAAAAARIASAALLDTLAACRGAFGLARCRLALDGRLEDAVDSLVLIRALHGWRVVPQVGESLGERIAVGCAGVETPVIQIGMDTPQVTAALLRGAAAALDDHDAVLGPAEDGGWWLLGLREPAYAAAIAEVPMSTSTTGERTRQALVSAGLAVATGPVLRDIDELADLRAVATLAPATRTAATTAEVLR
jgi:rSAM/selenodomain-associated transferase 1